MTQSPPLTRWSYILILGEKKKHTRTALKSERHMKWTIKVYGTFTYKMFPIPSQEKWRNFNQVKDQRRQMLLLGAHQHHEHLCI
jgi:hypothetical protein